MTTPVLRCSLAAPLFGCTGWVRTKFSYIQFTPQAFFLFSLALSLSLSLTLTLLLSDGARALSLSLSLSLFAGGVGTEHNANVIWACFFGLI